MANKRLNGTATNCVDFRLTEENISSHGLLPLIKAGSGITDHIVVRSFVCASFGLLSCPFICCCVVSHTVQFLQWRCSHSWFARSFIRLRVASVAVHHHRSFALWSVT